MIFNQINFLVIYIKTADDLDFQLLLGQFAPTVNCLSFMRRPELSC